MTKFYFTENTAVALMHDGKKFEFEPFSFYNSTNSWWGILKTDSASDIAALDDLAAKGRIGEITEEDYNKYLQKKKSVSDLITSIPLKSPLDPEHPSPVVAEPVVIPAAPKKPTSSIDDVVTPRRTRK